jgi:phage shock protein A
MARGDEIVISDHPTTDKLHRALVAAVNRHAQQLDALERSLAGLNKQMAELRHQLGLLVGDNPRE